MQEILIKFSTAITEVSQDFWWAYGNCMCIQIYIIFHIYIPAIPKNRRLCHRLKYTKVKKKKQYLFDHKTFPQ